MFFGHLQKNLDDGLDWNFDPKKISLPESINEKMKLVSDMENVRNSLKLTFLSLQEMFLFQDVLSKSNSSVGIKQQKEKKNQELESISLRNAALCAELEKVSDFKKSLETKKNSRGEKLKHFQEKQKNKQEAYEKSKDCTYVDRAKDHLGLEISLTTNDTTILTFTNIDQSEADRKFLCEFSLYGPEKRTYKGNFLKK